MLLDGYVRVSQVAGRSGPSFISPSVQRQAIENWASLREERLGEIFEELDESGARRDRPGLQEALARVECGESNGIVVAKLDRFGRSLVDGLAAIERITSAGGTFVSVQDGLDLSTDTGKLVLKIMLSMAEWELDRCRSNWAVAQSRAISRGISMGATPTGYLRRADGRLEPDPRLAPLITELFRRRAGGVSIAGLRHWINAQAIPAPRGGRWTSSTIDSILKRPTYLGGVRHGQFVNREAHEPLVDAATWHQAQRPMRRYQRRIDQAPALLKGLLRCAGCQHPMTAVTIRKPGSAAMTRYQCPTVDTSAGTCRARTAITDTIVEPYIEALFWQELEAPRVRRHREQLKQIEAHVTRDEKALVRYRDNDRLAQTLGTTRFEQGVAVRVARVDMALLQLHQARRAAEGPSLPAAKQLRATWAAMSIAERHDAMAELLEVLFVAKGRADPGRRLFAFLRGRAPASLQSADRPSSLAELVPFDPAKDGRGVRLRRASARPIGDATLRRRLELFLEGHEQWPSYVDFQEAGEGLLYWQVQQAGGRNRWARKFERGWEAPERHKTVWPDDTIEAALRPFLTPLTVWPTQKEFKAAGLRVARDAVTQAGGSVRWARHFDLELPRRRRTERARWTDDHIESTLREFMAGRETWPPRRDFDAAGLRGLYQAILRRGDRERWAQRLGVTVPGRERVCGPYRWPDAAIEAKLQPLIASQSWFPTKAQFDQAELSSLYDVVRLSQRGLDGWAVAVELPRRPGGRLPRQA